MSSADESSSLFPHDLFEAPADSSDLACWVLYTKARHEKALARAACEREVSHFLPLLREEKYSRGRRHSVHTPLFPGYVFLFGTEDDRVWSLTTKHVSRVLTVPDSQRIMADLGQIHNLLGANALVTPERRLGPGKRVRVRSGPLAGMTGMIIVRRGEARLLVSVDFLQQGASVEIDDFMLEEIE